MSNRTTFDIIGIRFRQQGLESSVFPYYFPTTMEGFTDDELINGNTISITLVCTDPNEGVRSRRILNVRLVSGYGRASLLHEESWTKFLTDITWLS